MRVGGTGVNSPSGEASTSASPERDVLPDLEVREAGPVERQHEPVGRLTDAPRHPERSCRTCGGCERHVEPCLPEGRKAVPAAPHVVVQGKVSTISNDSGSSAKPHSEYTSPPARDSDRTYGSADAWTGDGRCRVNTGVPPETSYSEIVCPLSITTVWSSTPQEAPTYWSLKPASAGMVAPTAPSRTTAL